MPTSVLALVPDQFEELELVAPVDVLRRAGVSVTLAALGDGIHCTGRNGIVLHADTSLAAVPDSQAFDLLLLPGGPGVKALRADVRVAPMVRAYLAASKRVAAICAAPTVLLDAGVLAGRRYTAHPSTRSELPAALPDPVVIDGPVITSGGAGTALAFGLALVAVLVSPEKEAEIAASIRA